MVELLTKKTGAANLATPVKESGTGVPPVNHAQDARAT